MTYTDHAVKKASRRGITPEKQRVVFQYGESRRRNGGVEEYILTEKMANRAIENLKKEIKNIEHSKNVTFIYDDETVITTYRNSQRWKKDNK